MRRTPRPEPPPGELRREREAARPGRSSGETGEVRSGFCPVPRGHGGGRREEEAPPQAEQVQGGGARRPGGVPAARSGSRPPQADPARHPPGDGSAMPCTEFDRPDPLAGDRIMDATARLLAPRRLTLSPVSSREEHGAPESALLDRPLSPARRARARRAALPTPPPRRRAGSRRRPSIKSPPRAAGRTAAAPSRTRPVPPDIPRTPPSRKA